MPPIETNYYVYAYIRDKDDSIGKAGTPYYIGKGKRNRAYAPHRVPIPKDRSLIVFMEKNLTDVGARAIEKRMIEWWGRVSASNGVLDNLSIGATCGHSGRSHSPESRKKISDTLKENPVRYWKGKRRSEDTKRKISKTKKGTMQSAEHKEQNSKKIKALWADPIWRENMLNARKRGKNANLLV